MAKPDFDTLWRNFPDYSKYPTLGDLDRALGGTAERNIASPGFGETVS